MPEHSLDSTPNRKSGMTRPLVRSLVLPCALAASALALLPLLAQQPRGKKYALFVGVNEYDSKHLSKLNYPENDVTKTARAAPGERCCGGATARWSGDPRLQAGADAGA